MPSPVPCGSLPAGFAARIRSFCLSWKGPFQLERAWAWQDGTDLPTPDLVEFQACEFLRPKRAAGNEMKRTLGGSTFRI